MSVICFGDSNTYGYDPRSYFGDRYPSSHRWVDILADKTGWMIRNQGMNGREIPRISVSFPHDTQLLLIMLGTNDLLQGCNAEVAAQRMERFLTSVSVPYHRVVLIVPPTMVRGAWVADESLITESAKLSLAYETLASRLHIRFADASKWEVSLCYDGVHFTEAGHIRFAQELYEFLKKENLLCLR